MRRGRSGISKVRNFALAMLVLVPLVASGHHHSGTIAPLSCAVCVATHHAPATVVPTPATFTMALNLTAPIDLPQLVPPARVHSPMAGRAPPSSSSISVS